VCGCDLRQKSVAWSKSVVCMRVLCIKNLSHVATSVLQRAISQCLCLALSCNCHVVFCMSCLVCHVMGVLQVAVDGIVDVLAHLVLQVPVDGKNLVRQAFHLFRLRSGIAFPPDPPDLCVHVVCMGVHLFASRVCSTVCEREGVAYAVCQSGGCQWARDDATHDS